MSNDNASDHPSERLLFAVRLTPHRSLDRTGFVVFMAAVTGVSFVAGLAFVAMGAWPVTGFFGLDVALIYAAFRLNYRHGRAFEEVDLAADRLTVRRVDPAGRMAEWSCNPYWARLEVERSPEWGVTALRIRSHGEALEVGGFLSPDDRSSFADAFAAALSRLRRAMGPELQESGG